MNELEIVVTVNELEIVRIHQNDTANITLDAYDDYTFKGIVTDMAISTINTLSLTSADEVSTYEVKIRLLPSSYQNLLTNTETPYPDVYKRQILIKLIYRETSKTSYNLIKDYRGSFLSSIYQGIAKIFGLNLKDTYDPEGKDRNIEIIVKLIENGQL